MQKIGLRLVALLMAAPTLSACGDFFEQDSDHFIYADDHSLNNATDTMYSVLGIINKMQALADRTILLGELRGDLVDVNSNTSSDLRDVATFNVADDNAYNSPRDYYAVINNCNYFLAKADTNLTNNSNVKIFEKEYAAVKAFRAWAYLQLALNYGRVPLVTTPILTKDDSEREYERRDIKGICEYFINDIAPYARVEKPSYGTLRGSDSKKFFFPIYILLGDLNLWAGNYREAALNYYRYLSTRNGDNSVTPEGGMLVMWYSLSGTTMTDSWSSVISSESLSNSDLITMIPGDSIQAEGNYSQLRNLFNTNAANDYKASINPSDTLKNLSAAQRYCYVNASGVAFDIPENASTNFIYSKGDLRLGKVVSTSRYSITGDAIGNGGTQKDYQSISKHQQQNVHIYRTSMVYLRMAEALNRAGFPEVAYKVLESGLNNSVIDDVIANGEYSEADAAWLKQFDFPNTSYVLATYSNTALASSVTYNTTGIHRHGSGFGTTENGFYPIPTAATREELIEKVEDLIMDEEALEFAFEGYRYYDLMRIALRRNNPGYLAGHVYGRRGAAKVDEMKQLIKKDLTQTSNWYLDWNGQIGIGVGQ